MPTIAVFFFTFASGLHADTGSSVVSQDITIRGKTQRGPALPAPPTTIEKPVFDEVLESLELHRKDYADKAPKRKARKSFRIFPRSPYILFSPKTYQLPFDRWSLEVLAGEELVKRLEGEAPAESRIGWDGTDQAGQIAIKADQQYAIRFTGSEKGQETSLSSDPIELGSLEIREGRGFVRLEVSNKILFPEEKAALKASALDHLTELISRMRQHNPKSRAYRLILYQKEPESKIAQARAGVLERYLSKELLVNRDRVDVQVFPLEDRGDILSFRLENTARLEDD